MADKRPKARRGTVATGELNAVAADVRTDGAAPAAAPTGTACTVQMRRAGHCVATYAGYSKKGFASYNRDKKNQDRGVWEVDEASGALLLCVFDGHGPVGEKVSGLFKARMPSYVFGQLASGANPGDALRYGLEKAEEDLFSDPRIDKTFSGTTAVCCLLIGDKLTVANVGDSRIILAAAAAGGKEVAEEVSIDHKPERPDEKARIHAAGGRVFAEIFEDDDLDGPARVWLADMDIPGLAMSRSMGDAIAKQAGVISTPELYERTIGPEHLYLIMGSDGLWEFISNQESVDMVTPLGDPAKAVDVLVAEANRRWTVEDEDSIDDTTVIVAFFHKALEVRGVPPVAAAAGAEPAAAVANAAVAGGAGAGSGAGAGAAPAPNGATGAEPAEAAASSGANVAGSSGDSGAGSAAGAGAASSAPSGAQSGQAGSGGGAAGATATRPAAASPSTATSGSDDSDSDSEGEQVAPDWKKYVDDDTAKVYFFNTRTQQTIWEDPACPGLDGAIAFAAAAAGGGAQRTNGTAAAGATASAGGTGGANGAGTASKASEWEVHEDPTSKRKYWFNVKTLESRWTPPDGAGGEADKAKADVWEEHVDPTTNKRYYFNKARRKSLWTRPTDPGAVIKALPGAAAKHVEETQVVVDKEGNQWEAHTDKNSKRTFFFNRKTGKSTWVHPVTGVAPAPAPAARTAAAAPTSAAAPAARPALAPAVPAASAGGGAGAGVAPPQVPQ